MMKYENAGHLSAKIDWEGGVYEFVNGYGLDISELPDDTPEDVIAAFVKVQGVKDAVDKIYDWLPDPDYDY